MRQLLKWTDGTRRVVDDMTLRASIVLSADEAKFPLGAYELAVQVAPEEAVKARVVRSGTVADVLAEYGHILAERDKIYLEVVKPLKIGEADGLHAIAKRAGLVSRGEALHHGNGEYCRTLYYIPEAGSWKN